MSSHTSGSLHDTDRKVKETTDEEDHKYSSEHATAGCSPAKCMIDGGHGRKEETRPAATEWEMRHDGDVLPGSLLVSELEGEACFIFIGTSTLP